MTYEEFLKYVESHFLEYMPGEYQDNIVEVNYVRSVVEPYHGVMLRKPELDQQLVTAIHLKPFFQKIEKGEKTLDGGMRDLAALYQAVVKKQEKAGIPDLSKENVLKNLFPVVVNYERACLDEIPYTRIHDLALIAKSEITEKNIVTVTNKMAEALGMNGREMLEIAMENHTKFSAPILDTWLNANWKYQEETGELLVTTKPTGNEPIQMYILTNEQRIYGASLLVDSSVLDGVSKKLNSDLLIMPLSIHELVILPASSDDGNMILFAKAMAEEMQRIFDRPQYFLSDNVYVYRAKTKELTVYTGVPDKQKEIVQNTFGKPYRPKR